MIVGLGVDVVEISRIAAMLERHRGRFLERVLTEQERRYCLARALPAESVAARIAAKEAGFKALSGPSQGRSISWQHLEVLVDARRPRLALYGPALECAAALGVERCWLSLTHSHGVAVAVVVLESAAGDTRVFR
jgi:holo-[acyl-carrier protein] synthase